MRTTKRSRLLILAVCNNWLSCSKRSLFICRRYCDLPLGFSFRRLLMDTQHLAYVILRKNFLYALSYSLFVHWMGSNRIMHLSWRNLHTHLRWSETLRVSYFYTGVIPSLMGSRILRRRPSKRLRRRSRPSRKNRKTKNREARRQAKMLEIRRLYLENLGPFRLVFVYLNHHWNLWQHEW